MRNTEFIKLFVGFGIGLGIFNSVLTVNAQMIQPLYYNNTAHKFPNGSYETPCIYPNGTQASTLNWGGEGGGRERVVCVHLYSVML